MPSNGKLEGALHIPAAGWGLTLTDGTASGATVTVPGDGYRFLSSSGDLTDGLMLELKQQLDTAGDTYTVTLSSSTGKVTITNTDAPGGFTAITWVDTDMRDALGFTGNLSGANTYTGTNHAGGLWLPDCPWNKLHGNNWPGQDFANLVTSESVDGSVFGLRTGRKTILSSLRWDAVTKAKAWIVSESTTGESLQQFWRDVILGEAGYGQPTGPIRFHEDATDDATYQTYRVTDFASFDPEQRVKDLDLVWSIGFRRLVLLPS